VSPITEWNQQKVMAEVSGQVINGMDRACAFAAEQARPRAPRRKGTLAGLITHEVVPVGNTVEGRVGVSKGKYAGDRSNQGEAFYGRFHELGTVKMPARPFLRPAVYENADEITRLIAEG
jgi:HK97 gp10 family phage protein